MPLLPRGLSAAVYPADPALLRERGRDSPSPSVVDMSLSVFAGMLASFSARLAVALDAVSISIAPCACSLSTLALFLISTSGSSAEVSPGESRRVAPVVSDTTIGREISRLLILTGILTLLFPLARPPPDGQPLGAVAACWLWLLPEPLALVLAIQAARAGRPRRHADHLVPCHPQTGRTRGCAGQPRAPSRYAAHVGWRRHDA